MLRRFTAIISLGAAALVLTAAAPDADAAERAMLDAFDAALDRGRLRRLRPGPVRAGLGRLPLMADGAEGRGTRARSAVFLTIAGLGVALSAKGLAALISAGVIPIPIP